MEDRSTVLAQQHRRHDHRICEDVHSVPSVESQSLTRDPNGETRNNHYVPTCGKQEQSISDNGPARGNHEQSITDNGPVRGNH